MVLYILHGWGLLSDSQNDMNGNYCQMWVCDKKFRFFSDAFVVALLTFMGRPHELRVHLPCTWSDSVVMTCPAQMRHLLTYHLHGTVLTGSLEGQCIEKWGIPHIECHRDGRHDVYKSVRIHPLNYWQYWFWPQRELLPPPYLSSFDRGPSIALIIVHRLRCFYLGQGTPFPAIYYWGFWGPEKIRPLARQTAQFGEAVAALTDWRN